jgi:hypothetical protein
MTAFVCWLVVDRAIIDGLLVDRSAGAIYRGAGRLRASQSGVVSVGIGLIAAGAFGLLAYVWWLRYG